MFIGEGMRVDTRKPKVYENGGITFWCYTGKSIFYENLIHKHFIMISLCVIQESLEKLHKYSQNWQLDSILKGHFRRKNYLIFRKI